METLENDDNIDEEDKKADLAIKTHYSDPYMGFPTLDDAIAASSFTSQAEVLARLIRRENLFISGLAGAGKTTVINRFKDYIESKFENFKVEVTASTGIAATLINGTTIHSWAGLGISTEPFNPEKPESNMWMASKRMQAADVLIIDEVSMIPAHLFTKLDAVMKHYRYSDEPFGGVQLVLLGDFLQLPPVDRKEEGVDNRFAIETEAWHNANIRYCFLDKTYRASDERLKNILIEISNDAVSEDSKKLIRSRMYNKAEDPNKVYTTLFTTNRNVEKYNQEQLDKNSNEPHFFYKKNISGDPKNLEKLAKQQGIPACIQLKIGATVIMTKNTEHQVFYTERSLQDSINKRRVVNGSIGVVINFIEGLPVVKFNNGTILTISLANYRLEEKIALPATVDKDGKKKNNFEIRTLASINQLPLKLGYAITVHKSQGQTFDGVRTNLKNCFQPGLGYVALSRVRSLDDLIIEGIDDKAYQVSEKARKISKFVRKKAYLERSIFLEDKETYDNFLTSAYTQMIEWNDETLSSNAQKRRTAIHLKAKREKEKAEKEEKELNDLKNSLEKIKHKNEKNKDKKDNLPKINIFGESSEESNNIEDVVKYINEIEEQIREKEENSLDDGLAF